jgi:hypothetical protein
MPYCRDCAAWAELAAAPAPAGGTPPRRFGQCRRHAPRPVSVYETKRTWASAGPDAGMTQCWPQVGEDDWCLEGVDKSQG